MRKVSTKPPSFPDVAFDRLLSPDPTGRWQVLCGDGGHWRVGLYRPPESSRGEVLELERHDCPEFFLLLDGTLTLVISEGGEVKDVPLEIGRPILVTSPHSGYCPNGPYTGTALVVERDAFETEYRSVEKWK